MRRIGLDVGTALGAVEDVVSRVMYKLHVGLPAGHSEIANRERVGLKSCQRLLLRDVDLIVRGGIQHDRGVGVRDRIFDTNRVGDVKRLPIKALHGPLPALKFAAQLDPELPAASKYNSLTLH